MTVSLVECPHQHWIGTASLTPLPLNTSMKICQHQPVRQVLMASRPFVRHPHRPPKNRLELKSRLEHPIIAYDSYHFKDPPPFLSFKKKKERGKHTSIRSSWTPCCRTPRGHGSNSPCFYCEATGAIGFTQGHLGILMDITFEVNQLCEPA